MKILIIGGTAFTGPHIVRELAALGHDVGVYHRGEHPMELPAGVRKINAELSMLGSYYRDALRKLNFDVVLHMIAMSGDDARQAIGTFSGYAGRMVVASSQDVYAAFGALLRKEEREPSALPLSESSPLRTARYIQGGDDSSAYEKIDVEEAFLQNADQLPVTILRMPAVYGPEDGRHRFFPYVKRFDDQRPVILLEPVFGNFRWSYGYVENVAHAFALAVTTPHPAEMPVRIYNVSEPRTPTVGERLHEIARAAGYRGKIVVVPRDRCPPHLLKPQDFRHDVVASDAAIRKELGFAEIVPAEEGLRRTIAWQRTLCPVQIRAAEYDYVVEDQLLREFGMLPS